MKVFLMTSPAIKWTWILFLAAFIGPSGTLADELPRAKRRLVVERVIPAMERGDRHTFLDVYSQIVAKSSDEAIQQVEALILSKTNQSALALFADLMMSEAEQLGSHALNQRKFSLREAEILITGINKRVDQFFEQVHDNPFMDDPIDVPENWKSSRDAFWDVHVLKNEFSNHKSLFAFGDAILDPLRARIQRSDNQNFLNQIVKFRQSQTQFPTLRHALHEREAEARLIRFEQSMERLKNSESFSDKFIAAMSIELDAEVLEGILPDGSLKFHRTALQQPGLKSEVHAKRNIARSLHPELMRKAALFRSGSHWWLRGRYGRGTYANGLLKPRSAISSDEVMQALYMPRSRPVPDDNFTGAGTSEPGEASPYYKRRHYYTWALEYRPLLTSVTTTKERTETIEREIAGSKTTSHGDFFY